MCYLRFGADILLDTKIQSNNNNNESHKKRRYRSKDVYKTYIANGVYSDDRRKTLLNNDNNDN